MKKRKKKLPPFVVEKLGKWYVRRTTSSDGKQKQIWRVCNPPTAERASEILAAIDESIKVQLSGAPREKTNFAEVCDEFAAVELVEPVYEQNRKVACLECKLSKEQQRYDKFKHRVLN